MPMKKKILYIAVIVISLAIIAAGTVAFFTEEVQARNVITTGRVDITVVDEFGTPGSPAPILVMPTAVLRRTAAVKTADDASAAWVRGEVVITVLDEAGQPMPHTKEQLDEIITVKMNTADWTERDGWYYYKESVKEGETTALLFDEISFSGPNLGNEYQKATVYVTVNAQAIQKAHNGTTALDAYWPAD